MSRIRNTGALRWPAAQGDENQAQGLSTIYKYTGTYFSSFGFADATPHWEIILYAKIYQTYGLSTGGKEC